jgi:hypothetical protein
MANYNPSPKSRRHFKKGNCANPKGAGAHNKDLRIVRKLTQAEIAEVGGFILNNNLKALKETKKDPNSSVFKVWVCSVAEKAIYRGDAVALNVLLDRIVGKVKDKIEHIGLVANVPTSPEEAKEIVAKLESEC